MESGDNDSTLTRAAELFAAMGNQRRLHVLLYLGSGEKTVSDITDVVGISQSALSQHLAVLRRADVVETRREGQSVYYRVKSEAVLNMLGFLVEQGPAGSWAIPAFPQVWGTKR